MSLLVASVVMLMLSAGVSDYIDNSNGHSVYKTTITVGTLPLVKSSSSTTKHLVPEKVSIDINCFDFSHNSEMNVDNIHLVPQDSWLLAKQNLDPLSMGLLETKALEGAHETCSKVLESERYYQYQQSTKQEV
jgi:hypothetical protein